MRISLAFLWIGLAVSTLSSPVWGQPERRSPRSRPGTEGATTLKRAGLKVGMKMPSVKIFDDQGKEFNTSSLKGSYTVLTFGCLT